MDLDFDLDDDKIKSFLQNKLEEVRSKNERLERTLDERNQFLREITETNNAQMDESNVNVSEVWKKIFNNKYAIGVTIVNQGCGCLHNLKTILNWNSTYPLVYQVHIFEENNYLPCKGVDKLTFVCPEEDCTSVTSTFKKSDEIDKSAHLLITLDQPTFIDDLSYTITGNIIFRQDDKEFTLVFPGMEISSSDATHHELHEFLPSKGDIKDILAMMSCSEQNNLVAIFPNEWSSSLDGTFEILCSLRKIDVASKCTRFYVAHKLSPSFDDSLVQVHAPGKTDSKISDVTIYSRNEDHLYALLHHLHRSMTGVVIVPKALYESYILHHPDRAPEDSVERFKQCAEREIKLVKDFQRTCLSVQNVDSNDVVKFRSDLADLEKDTDLFYLRIRQRNDK